MLYGKGLMAVLVLANVACTAQTTDRPASSMTVNGAHASQVDSVNATSAQITTQKAKDTSVTMNKIVKSEEEWKAELTPAEYRVLRQKGTDRAFSGEYVNTNDAGMYVCRACGAPLYSSKTKFESHCGWPSFYDAIDSGAIIETPDNTLGMNRTELTCAKCGSHLGHIFDDGPLPTGNRHCINSTSLKFQPAEEK